jgi:RimJ/RimL family protein N-acetyltransferase
MIVRKLKSTKDKELVKLHLYSLTGEDRRLRFGSMVSDTYIRDYVDLSWNDEKNQWFGCIVNGALVSACHVAIYNNEGELGCSVDKNYRGHGLAQEMFDRAVTYLRTQNIKEVYMHCLTENQAMRHIAKKHDMVVVSCDGETDAKVKVEPPTPLTIYKDAYLDRVAIYDMVIRTHSEIYERWLNAFRYERKKEI